MKLVLLDRDGVINEDRPDLVKSADELNIFPQAFEALALLKKQGFTCVIITNQSVVGRGIISTDALLHIHEYLCQKIVEHGGHIEEIFFCPDHPDHATYRRKPNPGMLIEALEKYGADAASTAFVGDTVTDMQAAHQVGCPRYLTMTGHGRKSLASLPADLHPVLSCTDILDAAHKIVDRWQ